MNWRLFTAMAALFGAVAFASCDSGKNDDDLCPGETRILSPTGGCCDDKNYNGVCDNAESPFTEPDIYQPKEDIQPEADVKIVEDSIEQILDTIPHQDIVPEVDQHLPNDSIETDIYSEVNPDISPEVDNPGEFGDPCNQNSDCYSNLCLMIQGEKSCTTTCIDYCMEDWTCQYISTGGNEVQGFCFPLDYSDEFCDGKDNNYNGQVDEDLTKSCGNENPWGYCYGQEVCSNGTWSACNAAVPSKEICDNKDNDCNGNTDDNVGDIWIDCDNGKEMYQYCSDGEWFDVGSCD